MRKPTARQPSASRTRLPSGLRPAATAVAMATASARRDGADHQQMDGRRPDDQVQARLGPQQQQGALGRQQRQQHDHGPPPGRTRRAGLLGWWARVLAMTSGLPQQPAVASRVGRLAERAMTFAVDERDDDLAVARLAWLAQDDQAALEEAAEVCLERAQGDLVVRARAAGLLARV